MIRVCMECHELSEIAYIDPLNRCYCTGCVVSSAVPIGSVYRALGLPACIPFKVGDRVGAFAAGGQFYDGVGVVIDIDLDIHHGFPAVPSFLVRIDHPADEDVAVEGRYLEGCLTLVSAGAGAGAVSS